MPSRAEDSARLIAEGDVLLREGDLDGADAEYREALATDPGCADAAWSIGCVESHRGAFGRSLTWAEKALEIDPAHEHARSLAGNALLGMERYEEALVQLRMVDADMAVAQSALCLEALGRYAEAEACLRTLLESDPAYVTRHAPIAQYHHHPFWADAHHVLARVLQRQGKDEEARLHYHLAKRVDPTTELDPMYLDVMSREELEDHPVDSAREDWREAELDDGLREVLEMGRATDYDALVQMVQASDRDGLAERLAGFIQLYQSEGMFALSARMRTVGDVVTGEDARELFEGLATAEWQEQRSHTLAADTQIAPDCRGRLNLHHRPEHLARHVHQREDYHRRQRHHR